MLAEILRALKRARARAWASFVVFFFESSTKHKRTMRIRDKSKATDYSTEIVSIVRAAQKQYIIFRLRAKRTIKCKWKLSTILSIESLLCSHCGCVQMAAVVISLHPRTRQWLCSMRVRSYSIQVEWERVKAAETENVQAHHQKQAHSDLEEKRYV